MKLSQTQEEAFEYILNNSALSRTRIREKFFSGPLDPDNLWKITQDHRWSSGEQVLIEVLKIISTFHSDLKLQDLLYLDAHNREVVLRSLSIAFLAPAQSGISNG